MFIGERSDVNRRFSLYIPLRPIVSFLTSPTYELSKHLTKVLVGNTSSAVKNSTEFAEFIATQKLQQGECLVSFDVVSLFTRVPVDLSISVAKYCLGLDDTLQDQSTYPFQVFFPYSKCVLKLPTYV